MFRRIIERSPVRNLINRSPRGATLSNLPNEMHYNILMQMENVEDWKNYSLVYPHLVDDYFWRKLIVRFPNLTQNDLTRISWDSARNMVDFNFTLKKAIETNNVQLANQVLMCGGNAYEKDYASNLYFYKLVVNERFDMARVFINNGFNINSIFEGRTPLMYSIMRSNINSINFLLDNGADVNTAVLKDKKTPSPPPFSALSEFCYKYPFPKQQVILQLLLQHGADYNLKNYNNQVALHYLIFSLGLLLYQDFSGVELLNIQTLFTTFIRHTDMSIVDYDGKTFLHLLFKRRTPTFQEERGQILIFVITELLSEGVSINALDRFGKTAYDYAAGSCSTFLGNNGGLPGDQLMN
jgi:hypothetical protein